MSVIFVPDHASTQAFLARVDALMKQRMVAACIAVEGAAKRNVGGPGGGRLYGSHRASVPGAFPAKYTGLLQSSIRWVVAGLGKTLHGMVGSRAKHAPWLEYGTARMAPRPWLRRTINEMREVVARILLKGG
jgi:hypothetical protein